MNIDIEMRPGSSVAKVTMNAGETLTAEGGSMIAMSNDMQIETTTHKKGKRGIMKGLKRMIAGEGFFINHYTPGADGGEVYLAPTLPGDMFVKELNGENLVITGGGYLASEHGIEIDLKWGGFGKALLGGENLFWVNVSGSGKVLINAYGEIYPVEVDGNHIVDTGHIVAYEPSLEMKITKAGSSWMSSMLGGEGFVAKFSGKGIVWCQSHNPNSFGTAIGPSLRPI
ncbi:TIGR00266 family protein [Parvicella tangerina]|uniref:TIGR00266 family protein n=1 Tax=Parvicella tangerina TaxID=2829795 RepID=A0A916JQ85_9FLAO|nr:TIGR00266 family protein [Parvicella tangerina]CAG5086717.1 hypothetical protein CRYO30217_03253 [Parvicella tangerina]